MNYSLSLVNLITTYTQVFYPNSSNTMTAVGQHNDMLIHSDKMFGGPQSYQTSLTSV